MLLKVTSIISRTSRGILKPNFRAEPGETMTSRQRCREARRMETVRQSWQRNLTTLKRKNNMDLEAAYKREVGRTPSVQNTLEKGRDSGCGRIEDSNTICHGKHLVHWFQSQVQKGRKLA